MPCAGSWPGNGHGEIATATSGVGLTGKVHGLGVLGDVRKGTALAGTGVVAHGTLLSTGGRETGFPRTSFNGATCTMSLAPSFCLQDFKAAVERTLVAGISSGDTTFQAPAPRRGQMATEIKTIAAA